MNCRLGRIPSQRSSSLRTARSSIALSSPSIFPISLLMTQGAAFNMSASALPAFSEVDVAEAARRRSRASVAGANILRRFSNEMSFEASALNGLCCPRRHASTSGNHGGSHGTGDSAKQPQRPSKSVSIEQSTPNLSTSNAPKHSQRSSTATNSDARISCAEFEPSDYASITGTFINPFSAANKISVAMPLLCEMGFGLEFVSPQQMIEKNEGHPPARKKRGSGGPVTTPANKKEELRRKGFAAEDSSSLDQHGNPLLGLDVVLPNLILVSPDKLRQFAIDFRNLKSVLHIEAYKNKPYWRNLFKAFRANVVDPVPVVEGLLAKQAKKVSRQQEDAFGEPSLHELGSMEDKGEVVSVRRPTAGSRAAYMKSSRGGTTKPPMTAAQRASFLKAVVKTQGIMETQPLPSSPAAEDIAHPIVIEDKSSKRIPKSSPTDFVESDKPQPAAKPDRKASPASEPGKVPQATVTLNKEQLKAIELATKGYNLYIGGSAGTGKTQLLRALRHVLQKRLGLKVAMTATTGVAACNIAGRTTHRALSLSISGDVRNRDELLAYDVVIIDEVSMLSSHILQTLDEQMRLRAGHSPLPFGGVQIILSGDFLQLQSPDQDDILTSSLFRSNFVMCALRNIVRQRNEDFVSQLQQARRGTMPAELLKKTTEWETQLVPTLDAAVPHPSLVKKRIVIDPLPSNEDQTIRAEAEQSTTVTSEATTNDPSNTPGDSSGETTGPPALIATPSEEADPVHNIPVQPWHVLPKGTIFLTSKVRNANAINDEHLAHLPGRSFRMRCFPSEPVVLFGKELWTDHYILKVGHRFSPSKFRDWVHTKLVGIAETIRHEHICLYRMDKDCYILRVRVPQTSEHRENDRANIINRLVSLPTELALHILNDIPEMDSLNVELDHATTLRDTFISQESDYVRRVSMRRLSPEPAKLISSDAFSCAPPLAAGYQPKSEDHELHCVFTGTGPIDGPYYSARDEDILQKVLERDPCSHDWDIKIGAQVMLRANLNDTLVNGLVGRVIAMVPLSKEVIQGSQLGKDCLYKYLDLHLTMTGGEIPYLPIVDFGASGPFTLVHPFRKMVGGHADTNHWAIDSMCVPLTLAYAFTIHKVQGLTLGGRVHVDLNDSWMCPHLLYVAMSRVKNPDQLTISGFNPRCLVALPNAMLFDDSLPTSLEAEQFIPPWLFPALWKRFPDLRNARHRRLDEQRKASQQADKQKRAMASSLSQAMGQGSGGGGGGGAKTTTTFSIAPTYAPIVATGRRSDVAATPDAEAKADPTIALNMTVNEPDFAEAGAVRAAITEETSKRNAGVLMKSAQQSALYPRLSGSTPSLIAKPIATPAGGSGALPDVPIVVASQAPKKLSFADKLRQMQLEQQQQQQPVSQPTVVEQRSEESTPRPQAAFLSPEEEELLMDPHALLDGEGETLYKLHDAHEDDDQSDEVDTAEALLKSTYLDPPPSRGDK